MYGPKSKGPCRIKLRRWRMQNNYSLRDVSTMMDVSHSLYRYWENADIQKLKPEHYDTISRVTGLQPADIDVVEEA